MFVFFCGSRGFLSSLLCISRGIQGQDETSACHTDSLMCGQNHEGGSGKFLAWVKEQCCWRRMWLASELMGFCSCTWDGMKLRKGGMSGARKVEQERSMLLTEIDCLESNRAQLDQWNLRLKGRTGLGYTFYLLFNDIQQDVCSSQQTLLL